MKRFILFIIAIIILTLLSGCGAESEKRVFYIGAIPDQLQSIQRECFDELARILSEGTGLDVQYKEVTDYAAVVNGFARDEIQMVFFGGVTGVQAREMVEDSVAVVQRVEDAAFQSVFIAGADTGIDSLQDFRGRSFTFGSEGSTSGHIMPRYFLLQEGINPENDFIGEVGYSGSHDRTIELVTNGTYEGGALNISVWKRCVEENSLDYTRVKLVEETDYYYDYNFSMRSKAETDAAFGEGAYDKIIETLLEIDIRGNESLNRYFNSEGFIPANNEQYEMLREVMKGLGML